MSFRVLLKDKNFSDDVLENILHSAQKRKKDFLENYGVLFETKKIETAANFAKNILNDFSVKTFTEEYRFEPLPQVKKAVFFKLKGNGVFDGEKNHRLENIKAAVFAAQRGYKQTIADFKTADKLEDLISKDSPSFFILLNFGKEIIRLDPDNIDYCAIFQDLSPSSQDNFFKLFSILYRINPSIWNKTADLFISHKNIQYFVYEDSSFALKELLWLTKISALNQKNEK
ncbi:MAG: hypothetical protein AB1637_08955 [Elusimicrobiota bacterium]